MHFLCAAASKTGKQTTLQFKPVTKKPKKNAWSDEDVGLSDSEVEAEEAAAPRERVERKTKGESAWWPTLLPLLMDNSLSGVISYLFMLCLSHLSVLDN